MIDHAQAAKELFLKGYNCAQAVVCAFADVTGYDMTVERFIGIEDNEEDGRFIRK